MKAFPFHIRFYRLGLFAVVLSLSVLVAACGPRHNAELVVTACTDQDGIPLDDAVMITVDGVSKSWKPGETVSFPFQVESDAKTVRVRARAQNDYPYASQPAFTLVPDERKTLKLRFLRPYSITVQAFGVGDMPLADVGVYADTERVGVTDEQGQYTWTVSRAARAGEKIDVELRKGGEAATPGSVILRPNRFEYDVKGHLPLRGAPEATLATASESPPDPAPSTTQGPSQPPSNQTEPPAQTVATAPPVDSEPGADRRLPADASAAPPPDETTSEAASSPSPGPTTVPEASAASEPESPARAEPPSILQRGHQARQRGNLREAIARYAEVPPANREAYKRAQQHIGEIYFRDMQPPDYRQAIGAFQAILDADNSEYAAHNNLAAVYLEIDALDEAEQHLNRVLALKHRIPLAQRQQVEREARYRLGLIQFARFDKERVRDNKYERGLLAQSALQRFVDAVPSGHAPFAAKRQDARTRITTIREWLEQNR